MRKLANGQVIGTKETYSMPEFPFTINGNYNFDIDQLFQLTQYAYFKISKIASRGACLNEAYATAYYALYEVFGLEFFQNRLDWFAGFVFGFEDHNLILVKKWNPNPNEDLYFQATFRALQIMGVIDVRTEYFVLGRLEQNPEFQQGILDGHEIANKVFNWEDSPKLITNQVYKAYT